MSFRDASVRFIKGRKGELQFVVDEKHQPTRVSRWPPWWVGHLYGGGTQAFFTELADGRLVLLPFDYSVTSKAWFCQSGRHEKWMPISPKVSIRDCECPPYRFPVQKGANCQVVTGARSGSLTMSRRNATKPDLPLSINCESCHGPGREHVERAARDARTLRVSRSEYQGAFGPGLHGVPRRQDPDSCGPPSRWKQFAVFRKPAPQEGK